MIAPCARFRTKRHSLVTSHHTRAQRRIPHDLIHDEFQADGIALLRATPEANAASVDDHAPMRMLAPARPMVAFDAAANAIAFIDAGWARAR